MATKAKLHEILAVEKARTSQVKTLLEDTSRKFNKAADYFSGHLKSLKLIRDDPANAATEAAAREQRQLPTTVVETLEYLFKHWAVAEDVLLQKSLTNQVARGDIVLADGKVLASGVPVDELLGLENRLEELRKLFHAMPTNRADTKYAPSDDGRKGSWTAIDADITTKTERTKEPFIKAPATDKHAGTGRRGGEGRRGRHLHQHQALGCGHHAPEGPRHRADRRPDRRDQAGPHARQHGRGDRRASVGSRDHGLPDAGVQVSTAPTMILNRLLAVGRH